MDNQTSNQDSDQLFRQKSLARISSPEQLHDYMRVTSVRIWMLLGAIMLLLVGFVLLASMMNIESTIDVSVEIFQYTMEMEDGESQTFTVVSSALPSTMKDTLQTGMVLRVAGYTGKVQYIFMNDEELGVNYIMDEEHLQLPDGTYDGTLVLSSQTPISFLLN